MEVGPPGPDRTAVIPDTVAISQQRLKVERSCEWGKPVPLGVSFEFIVAS